MDWFDAITSRVANIGGTFALFGMLWMVVPRTWQKYRAWRNARSVLSIDREIALLSKLQISPSARIEFMLMRLMLLFMVAGFCLFISSYVQLSLDHSRWAQLIELIAGGAIYLLAAASIGQLNRLKNAEKLLERLHERRKKLDGK